MIHDMSNDFGHMLHEQLQEFAMILTKKYHYSFPAEFFDDYPRNSNQEESLKKGQPKEKFGDRGLSNVVEEFNKIRWVRSIMEYQLRFEELIALILNHNTYLTVLFHFKLLNWLEKRVEANSDDALAQEIDC